jgi:hypothetical protein
MSQYPPQPPNQYPSQPQWPPQQPPQYQPESQWPYPPKPPQKRSVGKFFAIGCGALAVLLALIIGIAVAVSSSTSGTSTTANTTSQATQPAQQVTQAAVTATPAHTLKWTTVQTFTGNGNKKTALFNAPGDWKIAWSCQGLNDGTGIDGVLYVSVYGSDGTPTDPAAVSGTCKYGKTTSDNTEEHQSGTFYLDINTGLSWTIQIQELK